MERMLFPRSESLLIADPSCETMLRSDSAPLFPISVSQRISCSIQRSTGLTVRLHNQLLKDAGPVTQDVCESCSCRQDQDKTQSPRPQTSLISHKVQAQVQPPDCCVLPQ
eukprot:765607-Hanusia_phi.AAC.2